MKSDFPISDPPRNVLLPAAYWQWVGQTSADGRYAPDGHIENLAPNEVFVFGANRNSFHGAGSAGWAYTGKPGNQYRAGNPLLKMPNGTKGYARKKLRHLHHSPARRQALRLAG